MNPHVWLAWLVEVRSLIGARSGEDREVGTQRSQVATLRTVSKQSIRICGDVGSGRNNDQNYQDSEYVAVCKTVQLSNRNGLRAINLARNLRSINSGSSTSSHSHRYQFFGTRNANKAADTSPK